MARASRAVGQAHAGAGEVAPLVYLDSPAIVKLVLPEAETAALVAFLGTRPRRVSSAQARVEVERAVRRLTSDPGRHALAEQVVRRLVLLAVATPILATAGRLARPTCGRSTRSTWPARSPCVRTWAPS
jgi:hypothetical protein